MPELPEVEVTRLGFAERIRGAVVLGVVMGKPLRWPIGCEISSLVNRRVRCVGRRGKYLLLELDHGTLLIHLGMSGSLKFDTNLPSVGPHDHFCLLTTQGELRLHDPRRFGAVVYVTDLQDPVACKLLGKLGVEPLSDEFDSTGFVAHMKSLRAPIKQTLLAGGVVVGVGNIYACEALFLAGIKPTLPSNAVGVQRLKKLHTTIKAVLTRAVASGGSTLRDFSGADGQVGHFQTQARVYGRESQPCYVCNTPICRLVQTQRSTYFCPRCQAR